MSRLAGNIDDFIFIESPKLILQLKKSERGTHVGLVRVKGKNKTFTRKQRIGKKVVIKKPIKSSLHPDNLSEINSLYDAGVEVIGGIHEEETFICKFKDGSSAIHKVMDAGDIVGEVVAYKISKILGWDVVPETIKVDYGKGVGSSQKWVPDGKEPMSSMDLSHSIKLEEKHLNDLSKIFIMDMINGNFDRHTGNIIIDKNDKCFSIDNEMWGKKNNAELHIEELKKMIKSSFGSVPMLRVLGESFSKNLELSQKFKDHVDFNLSQLIKHKDEIIQHWNKQIGDNIKAGEFMSSVDGVKNINKNLEYLEKYYQTLKNKGE